MAINIEAIFLCIYTVHTIFNQYYIWFGMALNNRKSAHLLSCQYVLGDTIFCVEVIKQNIEDLYLFCRKSSEILQQVWGGNWLCGDEEQWEWKVKRIWVCHLLRSRQRWPRLAEWTTPTRWKNSECVQFFLKYTTTSLKWAECYRKLIVT